MTCTLIPRGHVNEGDPLVRYLFFVVLHEVAHAVQDHRPPSEITSAQSQAQEDEANALAFAWFNGYLVTKAENGLSLYTQEELDATQQQMRERMEAARLRAGRRETPLLSSVTKPRVFLSPRSPR